MIHLHKVQNQVKLNCSDDPEKSGNLLPLEEEKKHCGKGIHEGLSICWQYSIS